MRLHKVFKTLSASLAMLTLTAGVAQAQTAPSGPLRIVVPYAAGGLADITARLIAEPLSSRLNQSVVVENRPGANGSIGAAHVAKAAPDGNTIALVVSSHAFGKALMPSLPYDPVKDFTPVSLVTRTAIVLVAAPTLPVKDVPELVAYAKQHPNELTFASPGLGSNVHIYGQWFADMAGLKMSHVPYKGSAAAHPDLMAGRTHIVFDTLGAVQPHIAGGRLKLLAAGALRLPQYPNVPTVAEAGYPGFSAESWGAVLAPAGTPQARVRQLNKEIVAALNTPAIKKRLEDAGAQVVGSTPEELGTLLAAEEKRFTSLIRDMGVKLD
ncbi:Bug family tripartite tricarboxylate transporter substrate binding protein [Hydrogenophaga palleronii]|uniref:Bug family tripartite tricarboxylate transporter substrate binding protein n=1 Tax=Hydrogenophaga palleronii TaxID=65655 RepID=UPI0008267498|nr:tripartite tricarboxylate transporter substrate binding protein [Hydrogenophaga palleronii]